jgi:putative tricarboxylic transport membrane protein
MEILSDLIYGIGVALSPINLLYLLIGVMVGIIVGMFPGLGPTAGIAILLPLTFGMDTTSAIVMLAAIYYGSMYGATITAIIINTPGAPAVVASTFDGYPLARQGRVGPALVMQAVASFVGGTVGVILISALAPTFAGMARTFGPPEYFLVVMLGLLTLIVLVGDNKLKGIASALVGFAIASAGVDLGTGQPRFTFGQAELIQGVHFIPVAIGLFGIGEVLYCMYTGLHRQAYKVQGAKGSEFWPSRKDWSVSKWTFPRASAIGFVGGVIPGAGATIASLVAYSLEKSISRVKHLFGKGAMPGLVAPEAANNAASAGAMIPLLTLGIPGSASTAMLLAAFILWGLRPGPLLMTEEPELAWGLIGSMYLGNMMLVAVCIFAIPVFIGILKLPYRILLPAIVVLCTVGSYSVNASMIETWIMVVLGGVGFLMKVYGWSPAALVVALVLAPIAERTLRQSLIIAQGNPMVFMARTTSQVLVGLLVLVAVTPVLFALYRRLRGKEKTRIVDLAAPEAVDPDTGLPEEEARSLQNPASDEPGAGSDGDSSGNGARSEGMRRSDQ